MKTTNFQLSPDFNQNVLNRIKAENHLRFKEVRQLWRFSLLTAASAAIIAVIFMVNTSKVDLAADLDFTSHLDEFSLTIDYWSNN